MKKNVLFLIAIFISIDANAAGVVLSDTAVDDDYSVVEEESLGTTQSPSADAYVGEQIRPASRNLLANDTSDPLFLVADNKFLSDTYLTYTDDKLRIGQYVGYGINHNLAVHVNMHYQIDFTHNDENGFSANEFGGTYRLNHGTNDSRIITDALFGLKLWGSSHVRTPEYADSSYFAGLRFGRQYTGLTLAGAVKSTWVFDDERGLSYIDFIPEVYFRFQYDWHGGFGVDVRRSTNTGLMDNQEWLNLKLLKQFGNTQYLGHFDYEFESHDIMVGLNVKILF